MKDAAITIKVLLDGVPWIRLMMIGNPRTDRNNRNMKDSAFTAWNTGLSLAFILIMVSLSKKRGELASFNRNQSGRLFTRA